MARPRSDSTVQRKIGERLVKSFSSDLEVPLEQEKKLDCGSSCTVKVDGYSANPPILCEAWAHHGPPKGGQLYKVMTDALKLIFVEKCLKKRHRKILLFSNEDARKPFIGKSWKAQFLRDYDIETKILPLSAKQRHELIEAQEQQKW